MDWIEGSKRIFNVKKPEHFTNFNHCEECADHDKILINSDFDTINLHQLGNPGWDPICFCSTEGKKYYMPAFIRLSLETINNDCYLAQFLFHLENDGSENKLVLSCNNEQRQFIVEFLEYIIEQYAESVDINMCSDDILRVREVWSMV